MKKLIVLSLLIIFSKSSFSQLVATTNYDELDKYEKKFIQKFSIDSLNRIKNYKDTCWQLQEINDKDLHNIFTNNDTTIVFFYKPTCYGFDDYFKKINKLSDEVKGKLIVVSESYYLGSIQSTFVEFNYNKQAYIIDKSFGKKLNTIKENFCKAVFKTLPKKFDYANFVWVDKEGKIIKIKNKL